VEHLQAEPEDRVGTTSSFLRVQHQLARLVAERPDPRVRRDQEEGALARETSVLTSS
jgi:hypothetical protein